MVTITELLERNKKVAATHTPLFKLSDGGAKPAVIVVCCADSRCSPSHIMDLQLGGEQFMENRLVYYHFPHSWRQYRLVVPNIVRRQIDTAVLRTAGGRVRSVLNDIIALDGFIGIKEVMIIHHTDCGGTYFTDESIREKLRKRLPEAQEVESMTFGTFTDVIASVKDDLELMRASKLVRKELSDNTHGFVYDIKSGLLERVDA